MRDLINILTESVTDDWFDGGFVTYKHPIAIKYDIAKEPGTIKTLEGPVRYDTGYIIITGPKGEKYPVTPEKFYSLYDIASEGEATPKKIYKVAKLADHDGSVKTSWGETLNYTNGNDYIVRHGPGDYGVVKTDIFAKTYHLPKGK